MAKMLLCLYEFGRLCLKRFYFNDEDDDENENFEEPSDFFQMTQFPLDTSNSLVNSAISICESSIFWRFLSLNKKLNKIKSTYEFLKELTEEVTGEE